MKRFEVKVGHVYKVKANHESHYLEGELFKVTNIDGDRVEYMYLSDGWESNKHCDDFTDEQLEVPTKLEMYLYGATNVEMD